MRGTLRLGGVRVKPYLNNAGYEHITYKTRRFSVHRLVAKKFVINPCPGYFNVVDHIDGCRTNNHADNLRWLTNNLNLASNRAKNVFVFYRRNRAGNRVPTGKYVGRVTICGQVHRVTPIMKDYDACAELTKKVKKALFEERYRRAIIDFNNSQGDFVSSEKSRGG